MCHVTHTQTYCTYTHIRGTHTHTNGVPRAVSKRASVIRDLGMRNDRERGNRNLKRVKGRLKKISSWRQRWRTKAKEK